MNLSEMMIILLVVMIGLLTVTIFFYAGQQALHWLEMPDSPQALASFVVHPQTSGMHPADAVPELAVSSLKLTGTPSQLESLDRFDTDGGNQNLINKRICEPSGDRAEPDRETRS